MKKDQDGLPKLENTKKGLGVIIADGRYEIHCDIIKIDNYVYPFSGGMSTIAESPIYLPAHRKPLKIGGKCNDTLFKIEKSDISESLRLRNEGSEYHYLIEPIHRTTANSFIQELQKTRNKWKYCEEF